MADNKDLKGPQDSSRINMNEDYEVQYWTNKFSCSKLELQDAVTSVGNSAQKVEEYLGMLTGKKSR
jgi:hypothetical protein